MSRDDVIMHKCWPFGAFKAQPESELDTNHAVYFTCHHTILRRDTETASEGTTSKSADTVVNVVATSMDVSWLGFESVRED